MHYENVHSVCVDRIIDTQHKLYCCVNVICLFVCLRFYVTLENFSNIRRRHHYGWRTSNFHLCHLAGTVLYSYCDTWHPFLMVISEDPSHSHLLPSVCQWSCDFFINEITASDAGPNIIRSHLFLFWWIVHKFIVMLYTHLRFYDNQSK